MYRLIVNEYKTRNYKIAHRTYARIILLTANALRKMSVFMKLRIKCNYAAEIEFPRSQTVRLCVLA